MDQKSELEPGSSRSGSRTSWVLHRWGLRINLLLILPALLLIAVAGYVGLTQKLDYARYDTRGVGTWDWFVNPLELHAYSRRPLITGDINGLWLQEDEQGSPQALWAVGDGGLILKSDDLGRTWARKPLRPGRPEHLRRLPVLEARSLTPTASELSEAERADLEDRLRTLADKLDKVRSTEAAMRRRVETVEKQLSEIALKLGQAPNTFTRMNADVLRKLQKTLPIPVGPMKELEALLAQRESFVEEQRRHAAEIAKLVPAQASLRARLAALEATAPQYAAEPRFATGDLEDPEAEQHLTRDLKAIAFAGLRGWAVGAHGVILESLDNGETWDLVAVGEAEDELLDLALSPDGEAGWIAGATGLLSLDPGERTWRHLQVPGFEALKLRALAVNPGPGKVVAVGDGGVMVSSADGGASWLLETADEPASLQDVVFITDPLSRMAEEIRFFARAVGDDGRLVVKDSTEVPPQALPAAEAEAQPGQRLLALWNDPRGQTTWIAGTGGFLWKLEQDSAPPVDLGLAEDLKALALDRSGERIWVAGGDGVILHSADGGARWDRLTYGAKALRSALESDPSSPLGRHVKAGNDGIVLGEESTPQDLEAFRNRHAHLPAPWTFVAVGFAFAGIALGLKRAPPEQRGRSVADQGISDSPLRPGDPDPLDFGAIAKAISNFLINDRTEPPLTIAVSGDWGTGKSSILNLVEHNLRQARRRPIWFNAWHHQNAESLLAALLQAIRKGAIPPWWQPDGWIYRFNLLRVRLRHNPEVMVVLIALFVFGLAYSLIVPVQNLYYVTLNLFHAESFSLGALAKTSPLIAGLIGTLGLALKLRSNLGATGLTPSMLWHGGSIRGRDLWERVDFRHRFACEFRDVTEALGPMTLVVIIDDLDRCRAKNIMDTLELMNFLVSSGKCYILVGLAPRQVMTSIKGELEVGVDPKHYMEKLINLQVPVPTLDDDDRRKLIDTFVERDTPEEAPEDKRREGRKTWRRAAAWALFVGVVAGRGLLMGVGTREGVEKVIAEANRSEAARPAAVQPAAESPAGQAGGAPSSAADSSAEAGTDETNATPDSDTALPEAPATVAPPTPEAYLIPGGERPRVAWPFLLFLAAAFGCAALVLRELWKRRELGAVQDSPEFQQALQKWNDMIQVGNTSPRALKRFMNKLRYLAMRQRAAAEGEAIPGLAGGSPGIPEDALVALSAIENYDPRLLDILAQSEGTEAALKEIKEPSLKQPLAKANSGFDWKSLIPDYLSLGTVVRTDVEDSQV